MRNKFYLSDLSILFVSLSPEWGTTERRCLKDVVNHRNAGGSITLLCLKGSYLDKEASEQDLPRIYLNELKESWSGRLNIYFFLQLFLNKISVDLVHVYHHFELYPIGLLLKYYSRIPLVYTFNRDVHDNDVFLGSFAHKRIDSVISFFSDGVDHASVEYDINQRKCHYFGLGLEFGKGPQQKSVFFGVTTFLERHENDLSQLNFLLDQIVLVLQQLSNSEREKFSFQIQTDIPWKNHHLFEKAKRTVLERHLEHFITFETVDFSSQDVEHGVRISFSTDEFISDVDVFALVSGSPILVPRHFSKTSLIQRFGGESFYPGDAREFTQKLLKLLRNFSRLQQDSSLSWREFHHLDQYDFQLSLLYEKLTLQRQRFVQMSKKKK